MSTVFVVEMHPANDPLKCNHCLKDAVVNVQLVAGKVSSRQRFCLTCFNKYVHALTKFQKKMAASATITYYEVMGQDFTAIDVVYDGVRFANFSKGDYEPDEIYPNQSTTFPVPDLDTLNAFLEALGCKEMK